MKSAKTISIIFVLWLMSTVLLKGITTNAYAQFLPIRNNTFQYSEVSKFKQIQFANFKIVFHPKDEVQAQRVAATLKSNLKDLGHSLNRELKPITLVLNGESLESNGYVTLAPKRSEWVLNGPFDIFMGATDWLTDLVVHEYRHVAQFDLFSESFASKFMKIFLGENGQGLVVTLGSPLWAAEGDAVVQETAMTQGGRGRTPMFTQLYRSLGTDNINYSFDQNLLGTFQRALPGPYEMGYQLSVAIREKSRNNAYADIFNFSARSFPNPFGFYNGVKNITGQSVEDYHQKIKTSFGLKDSEDSVSENEYEDYLFPKKYKDGFIALKRSLYDVPAFIYKTQDKEEHLFYPSLFHTSHKFDFNPPYIVINEKSFDSRYTLKEYSDIILFDVEKGKKITLTKDKNLFHPSFSFDKSSVLALRGYYQQQIIKIDIQTKVDRVIYNLPKDKHYSSIEDSPDGVFLVEKSFDGASRIVKLKDNRLIEMTQPEFIELGDLEYFNDQLYLTYPKQDSAQILRINLKTNERSFVTKDEIGCYAPHASKSGVTYSCFRSNGYKITTQDRIKNISFSKQRPQSIGKASRFEKQVDLSSSEKFNIKDEDLGGFNFHSWSIIAPPLSSLFIAQVQSNNILNTVGLTAGASYDIISEESSIFTSISYSRFYPIFDFDLIHQKRKLLDDVTKEDPITLNEWDENEAYFNIRLPYNQVFGAFIQSISLELGHRIIDISASNGQGVQLNDTTLGSNEAYLSWSFTKEMAFRDYYPRWGIDLQLAGLKAKDISGNSAQGELGGAYSRFYLPGFAFNHSIVLQAGVEEQLARTQYIYSSFFTASRGHNLFFDPKLEKYSFNYTLPIAYPDHAFGRWLYLKRIGLNLFYDQMRGVDEYLNFKRKRSSYGIEGIFDIHILRLEFPIGLGLRLAYAHEKEEVEGAVFLQTGLLEF